MKSTNYRYSEHVSEELEELKKFLCEKTNNKVITKCILSYRNDKKLIYSLQQKLDRKTEEYNNIMQLLKEKIIKEDHIQQKVIRHFNIK